MVDKANNKIQLTKDVKSDKPYDNENKFLTPRGQTNKESIKFKKFTCEDEETNPNNFSLNK